MISPDTLKDAFHTAELVTCPYHTLCVVECSNVYWTKVYHYDALLLKDKEACTV